MEAHRCSTCAFVAAARSRRPGRLPLGLLGPALLLWVASPLRPRGSPDADFAAPPGLSRKQKGGTLHTRNNLRPTEELPLPEPEAEAQPKEELPERRVPYTLHIVSHFPSNKHLHEESNARKAIERKIVDSFENLEDLIRHVEVNLQVSENFHRDLVPGGAKVSERDDDDQELVPKELPRMLTPYIFKVTVTLRNKRTVVLANAEKHAQPTLTEGLDHMVDVVKKSLREEKDKMLQAKRKEKEMGYDSYVEEDDVSIDATEADSILDEAKSLEDEKMEELYEKIEADQ